jgi:hypothetical protein
VAFTRELAMRKWYVPITVLGLGGVGVLLLSDRGRLAIRWLTDSFHRAPTLLEWNESAQSELDRIQAALNRIAESLEPQSQLGH